MIYRLVFLKEILSFSFSACILYIYLSPLWIVGHLMAGNSPFEEIRVGRWNLNHTQKCFSPYLMLLNLWAYKYANCVLSPKPWSPHWTRLLFLVYHAEPNKRRVTKFATESLYSGTSTKKSEECKNWLEDSWNGKEVVEMLDLEKVWLEENRLSLESLLAGKMGRVAALPVFEPIPPLMDYICLRFICASWTGCISQKSKVGDPLEILEVAMVSIFLSSSH